MREVVVDTALFLSSLVVSDENHAKAFSLIEEMDNEESIFHITLDTYLEVVSIINKIGGAEEAKEIKKIMDFWINAGKIKVYPVDEKRTEMAIDIAIKRKLRGTAALVAQLSEELRLPAVTLSKNL